MGATVAYLARDTPPNRFASRQDRRAVAVVAAAARPAAIESAAMVSRLPEWLRRIFQLGRQGSTKLEP